jgi:hypothetical protein
MIYIWRNCAVAKNLSSKATFPHFGVLAAGLPKAFYAKKDARADSLLATAQFLI